MKRNLTHLQDLVKKAVKAAGFEANKDDIRVEPTKTLEHGHFSTNVAMLLAGQLGRNPRGVAQAIVGHLKDSVIVKTDIAGPGFINLWLDQIFYTRVCRSLSQKMDAYLQESLGLEKHKKTMVIEYSSPNIAKPLGVHHLLSTIIGQTLCGLYRVYGYKVIAENYPGDIGTQFGKLIYAIRNWGDPDKIKKKPIEELLKLYVKFHDEAEKDDSLNQHCRNEYKKFEEGDRENRALWRKIVDWTFEDIQPLYDRLGVTFDGVHGESFFEDKMPAILEKGRKEGVFVEGEESAWIVKPDDPNDTPALIRKSDGTTLYLTRDLAQMKFFEDEYHPNVMVWVVDVAQSLHFKQRFQASFKLGLTNAELVHVVFGRMAFKDSAMSTRKGNIVRMEELLDEAEARALALVKEKAMEGLSAAEQKKLARQIGIGAVKYNILSQNRAHNMTFEWDKMLSFEGNSAPYLMYTATRAKSILRKGDLDIKKTAKFNLNLTDDHETRVVLDLMMYPEALRRAAEEFKPNHIANYLYGLAQNFNTLYNALPVLKAGDEASKKTRLLLTAAVIRVMEHGLSILGIEVPEKM